MTELLDDVLGGSADTAGVGRPRRDRDEPRLVDDELADRLLEQAREQGVELLGEDGLLKQMTKAILERSLAVELTATSVMRRATRPGPGRATAATAPHPSG